MTSPTIAIKHRPDDQVNTMTSPSAEQFERLISEVRHLAETIEGFKKTLLTVFNPGKMVYNNTEPDDLANETSMANKLSIPPRTLARYRREGKFPECWIKNGKRILWKVTETFDVWRRGIA